MCGDGITGRRCRDKNYFLSVLNGRQESTGNFSSRSPPRSYSDGLCGSFAFNRSVLYTRYFRRGLRLQRNIIIIVIVAYELGRRITRFIGAVLFWTGRRRVRRNDIGNFPCERSKIVGETKTTRVR